MDEYLKLIIKYTDIFYKYSNILNSQSKLISVIGKLYYHVGTSYFWLVYDDEEEYFDSNSIALRLYQEKVNLKELEISLEETKNYILLKYG